MAIKGVDTKCYILALFVRDDGERFLLGSGHYEFKDTQMHFAANAIQNDIVEVQGNDGFLLAGQVRRPGTQSFDGYVGDGTMSKEETESYRRQFFSFFRKNFFYKVIYVFSDGTAIQRKSGFLVDDPTVQELYQMYPEYHVALNFEDVNYYSYSEDEEGQEQYAKEATIDTSSMRATGGLVWDNLGVVWEATQWGGEQTASGTEITLQNDMSVMSIVDDIRLDGDTLQNGTPTPDAPIPVQTVAGEQTVTVSDGANSQSYTVSLGSIELCKIGDYQDYIYKGTDGWYLHKATNQITLDGSQPISLSNWRASSTSVGWVYAYNVFNSATIAASSVGAIVSDKLLAASFTSLFNKTQDNGIALYTNTAYGLTVRTTDLTLTTTSAINTYLTSNPITVYYALATPTDTQITDATLVGQLDALGAMRLFIGENNLIVQATGTNLPAPLSFKYYTTVAMTGAEWEEGGSGGATVVEVDSITNTYPIWRVKGPAVNPQLSVINTNTTIRYTGTVTSTQTLEIDMFNKTAKLNGVSVIGNVSGDWVSLAPGTNRVIYTAENADAQPSTIEWQEVVG